MRLGVEPWLTEAAIPQIHFVGRKIRIHRLDRGLSQAELGNKSASPSSKLRADVPSAPIPVWADSQRGGPFCGRQQPVRLGFTEHPFVVRVGITNQYIRVDPVARLCGRSVNPFEWAEAPYDPEQDPRAAEVMRRAQDFRMARGFIVPTHGITGCQACISVGGIVLDLNSRSEPAIHLMAMYGFDRLRRLLSPPSIIAHRLTKREREVLAWSAVGKSAWDTGEILNITSANRDLYESIIEHHFRLRQEVFVSERQWNALERPKQREIDAFDNEDTIYLLTLEGDRVIGGHRLYPTTKPTMIGEVFPHLASLRGAPSDPLIWEWSRYFIVKDRREGRLNLELMAGLIDISPETLDHVRKLGNIADFVLVREGPQRPLLDADLRYQRARAGDAQ
jgi:Autoinducer binding domain/Autoinducer synthase/Bacterial regulatory proteins, luxR family